MDCWEDLNELTPREVERLPWIPIEGNEHLTLEAGTFCIMEWPVPIENPVFDGVIRVGIALMDFGFYRIGEIHRGLRPKRRKPHTVH